MGLLQLSWPNKVVKRVQSSFLAYVLDGNLYSKSLKRMKLVLRKTIDDIICKMIIKLILIVLK